MGSIRKLETRRLPRSTSERRTKARLFAVLAVVVVIGLVPALAIPGDAGALGVPGIVGFITNDGLFFVQYGYTNFLGGATFVYNGSSIYTYALTVNLTSVSQYNETAHVSVYSYALNAVVATEAAPVAGYTSELIQLTIPVSHTYIEYRVTVDGTSGYFYSATPYSFLGLANLENGGVDLAIFIATGLFLVYALPMMIKAEFMTRRAIYAPKWNATMWLHGIFFGLLAWYFVNFPSINMAFHGWEFIIIPIPEALFLFFWAGGRHSTVRRALFIQVVPRIGQRLALIIREYYIGEDRDGDLVIILKPRSPMQWWYRSRGHHVKLFRRDDKGALEPFPLNVLEQPRLTEAQVRDPARFPRGAKFDAHDDFPVVTTQERTFSMRDESPVERVYFIPRQSAFKAEPPALVWHKDVPVPEHTNLVTGQVIEAGTKSKLCWPYIQDGRAEVTLCSWHFMDVLAQAMGYMTAEDLATECDNLAVQLWTERGFRHTETSRKADERLIAEEDIRNRPETDLAEDQLQSYVVPLPTRGRDRREHETQEGAGA